MNIEPHDDDVVTIIVDGDDKTLRVSELPKTVTGLLFEDEATDDVVEDLLKTLLGEGLYCEFLSAQSSGGWKKGKLRLRFEFITDEPGQPCPSDVVLSPKPDQQ